MSDQLSATAAFVRVARHGSFTRAALEMRISPSALSQTIRGLEHHLGVQLLRRSTRKVSLTEIGQQFYERVMPALSQLQSAVDAIDEARDIPSGTLRLTLPRIVQHTFLTPILTEFRHAYPEIKLDLTLDDGFVDLAAGGYDAGIRLGEQVAPNMIAVRLTPPQRLLVVGTPHYFRTHQPPKTPIDLQQHACIRFRLGGGSIYRWEFCEPKNKQEFAVDVEGPFTVNDAQLMLELARQGLALAYVFESQASADIRAKRLVAVLKEWSPAFPGFYLYYPRSPQMPRKLRVFADFLKPKLAANSRVLKSTSTNRSDLA